MYTLYHNSYCVTSCTPLVLVFAVEQDYCAPEPQCLNMGVCSELATGFSCDCPSQWTGITCGQYEQWLHSPLTHCYTVP